MVVPDIAGESPSAAASRNRRAVWTWLVFAVGGFAIAIATFVAYGEGRLLWGMLSGDAPGGSASLAMFVGMPMVGLLGLVYGIGFVSAYLSIALGVAATGAAAAIWRTGRISVGHLVGLLVTCPVAVCVQASVLGIRFDPTAEAEDDALTMPRVVILFSPLLVPALVGAWLIVRRWCDRGGDRMRYPAPTP